MLRRTTGMVGCAARRAPTAVRAVALKTNFRSPGGSPRAFSSWGIAAQQPPAATFVVIRPHSTMFRSMSSTPGMVDVDGDRAPINITDRCIKRVHKVVEGSDGFLRLRVDGGGCSGFQYKFIVDSAQEEDDIVIERDGAKVVVDESSLEFVKGATLDFVEEMISSSFQVVNNPQSESSCGCGTSFAPKA